MTKAEAPKFFILPLLPNQTPHRDGHCHVTKKPERMMGQSLVHRFLSGVFLRDVTAAKISKSINFSSQMWFLSGGLHACAPVILAPAATDGVGRA